MKREEKDNLIFFGEWVPYEEGNETSKEEARQYLKTWKKLLLIKLKYDLYKYEPWDGEMSDGDKMRDYPDSWYEHWVEHSSLMHAPFSSYGSLALKFCMKKKLPYQL